MIQNCETFPTKIKINLTETLKMIIVSVYSWQFVDWNNANRVNLPCSKSVILLRVFFSAVCHPPPFSIDFHAWNSPEERKELCLEHSMGTLYQSLEKIAARFPYHSSRVQLHPAKPQPSQARSRPGLFKSSVLYCRISLEFFHNWYSELIFWSFKCIL